ncbi:hypothetical protein H8356DRAFT_1364773 [Neocallimastix lanati (nom. inval.)]|nr:hypothetical protein H8356DRAFT_1364773 [Neocallimastix sp. JGI-2020a]
MNQILLFSNQEKSTISINKEIFSEDASSRRSLVLKSKVLHCKAIENYYQRVETGAVRMSHILPYKQILSHLDSHNECSALALSSLFMCVRPSLDFFPNRFGVYTDLSLTKANMKKHSLKVVLYHGLLFSDLLNHHRGRNKYTNPLINQSTNKNTYRDNHEIDTEILFQLVTEYLPPG